jgi:hypothetical protein
MLPQRHLQEAVQRLEDHLLTLPQAEIVTTHTFSPGRYERAIRIPPWTVLTGAEHRTPYKVRLERGTIAVNTDDGVVTLTAPIEFDAPAGVKRVGRVFDEEVVWVDVYDNPDDCQDIPTLENRLYVVPDCGMGDTRQQARLTHDREDFQKFLGQLGVTQAEMDAMVQIEHDLMPMPSEFNVEVRPSLIHGLGLFATREFMAGELICPGRLDGRRTPAGRYTNHSIMPNAAPIKLEDDIWAVAVSPIAMGSEIVIDYRMSMRVNFGIELQENPSCQDG